MSNKLIDNEKLMSILPLVPFTHVGTWQANFDIASVISGNNVDFGKIISPNESGKKTITVEFDIKGDNLDDFKEPIITEENKEDFNMLGREDNGPSAPGIWDSEW